MFIVTKQLLQAASEDTPDGRVYHPNGRAGYLLDAPTEKRVARFLTAFFFVQIAIIMVFVELGSRTNHRLAAMLACLPLVMAIRYLGLKLVLRGSPRVAARMRNEDRVRRVAATYSTERIYLMVLVVLVLIPTPLFVLRGEPPWERAAMVLALTLAAIWVCLFAVRVLRAKAAIRHQRGRPSKHEATDDT